MSAWAHLQFADTQGDLAAERSGWTVLGALVLPRAITGPVEEVAATAASRTGTVGTDAATCSSAGTPIVTHFEFGTTAYGSDTPSTTAGLDG